MSGAKNNTELRGITEVHTFTSISSNSYLTDESEKHSSNSIHSNPVPFSGSHRKKKLGMVTESQKNNRKKRNYGSKSKSRTSKHSNLSPTKQAMNPFTKRDSNTTHEMREVPSDVSNRDSRIKPPSYEMRRDMPTDQMVDSKTGSIPDSKKMIYRAKDPVVAGSENSFGYNPNHQKQISSKRASVQKPQTASKRTSKKSSVRMPQTTSKKESRYVPSSHHDPSKYDQSSKKDSRYVPSSHHDPSRHDPSSKHGHSSKKESKLHDPSSKKSSSRYNPSENSKRDTYGNASKGHSGSSTMRRLHDGDEIRRPDHDIRRPETQRYRNPEDDLVFGSDKNRPEQGMPMRKANGLNSASSNSQKDPYFRRETPAESQKMTRPSPRRVEYVKLNGDSYVGPDLNNLKKSPNRIPNTSGQMNP